MTAISALRPSRVALRMIAVLPSRCSAGTLINARLGEGFRTPAPWRTVVRGLGPAFESLPRRKPRAGRGAAWSGASYGDLRIADGSGVSARGPVARNLGGGNDDDDRVRSRGCGALALARRSGKD